MPKRSRRVRTAIENLGSRAKKQKTSDKENVSFTHFLTFKAKLIFVQSRPIECTSSVIASAVKTVSITALSKFPAESVASVSGQVSYQQLEKTVAAAAARTQPLTDNFASSLDDPLGTSQEPLAEDTDLKSSDEEGSGHESLALDGK